MKAMRLHSVASSPVLMAAEVPDPIPDAHEVLIRVCSVGVTPTELDWYPTTHSKDGAARDGAIPGHEFSGVVAAVGASVTGISAGAAVFGMNDWFADGASAEYCIARPADVVSKPDALSHAAAATVPISALTAWQGLYERARLRGGERVLIHGGAGAVGAFAIQLARRVGAYVIATASGENAEFAREQGADEVIDYRQAAFEKVVKSVDVVFDTVGGETLERSWQMLSSPTRMVTIATEGATDQRIKDAFFIVEPNREQLTQIADMLSRNEIRTFVKAVYGLEEAARAYLARTPGRGKAVMSVSNC